MASIQSTIGLLLILYLMWAISLSNTRFHQVWSLCLCSFGTLVFLLQHTPSWGEAISLCLLLCLVGGISLALSPASTIFQRSKSKPYNGSPALRILSPPVEALTDDGSGSYSSNIFIDVVAVHGLASNPDSAWDVRSTKDEKTGDAPEHYNWLSDALPKESLHARIMTFNHNTAWRADALNKSLKDHGNDMLRALRRVRKDHTRPIIFIGHSFGGLIIKQAIVNANEDRGDELHRGIVENGRGFIFIGVPHRGSRLTFLGELLAVFGHWKGSKTNLLEVLRPGSSTNEALREGFDKILGNNCGIQNTVCVFESRSETLLGCSIAQVVTKESAVLDNSKQIGHNKVHRLSQRFRSMDDEDYEDLMYFLRKWATDAKEAAQSMFYYIKKSSGDLNRQTLEMVAYL